MLLGALFNEVMYTFLKSAYKFLVFITLFGQSEDKIFMSKKHFLKNKSSKMEETAKIFKNIIYKLVLEFSCPSKILRQTTGCHNHRSLLHIIMKTYFF